MLLSTRGVLFEERFKKYADDHFRLRLPGAKYPYVDRYWNSWSCFWIETAPSIRKMFVASIAVIIEHMTNGCILPVSFLLTGNPTYYNLALYGEVAFMIYATTLLLASYALQRDVSIEQMHPAVWHLLILHHVASMMLCIGCIMFGDVVPKQLVCYVLLALLGLTSSLHYIGMILDIGPLSLANSPYIRVGHHVICLLLQIIFRGVYWLRLIALVFLHTLEVHGLWVLVAVMVPMLLFTAFNVDFIKFHVKATRGCFRQMQQYNQFKQT